MGVSSSQIQNQQDEIAIQPVSEGHWVSDAKTGWRWATEPIVSVPTIQKVPLPSSVPGLSGEVWGPYPKRFTKSFLGQNIFTPPESVDGVPILCRCREINQYVRDRSGGRMMGANLALAFGASPPACWEDSASFTEPYGGLQFSITTRHPAFYEYMASKNGTMGIAMNLAKGFVGGNGSNRSNRRNRRNRRNRSTRKGIRFLSYRHPEKEWKKLKASCPVGR